MNTLEKISSLALVVLTISIAFILYTNKETISSEGLSEINITEQKGALKNSFKEAREHLALARKLKEEEKIIEAIDQYHQAAKLHSEFMNSSDRDFLGDELKQVIKLSIVKLNQKLRQDPKNKEILAKLKIVHKMERNFGHGCE